MIVVDVEARLVRVGRIDLTARALVVRAVDLVDAAAIEVCESDEPLPIAYAQFACGSDRQIGRAVAGEDALSHETGRRFVDRELEVPIEIAVSNSLLDCLDDPFDAADLDDALHAAARTKAERDGSDDAEESV